MIHVDAENRGKQVADVLAGIERVGRVGRSSVAGRNVEKTVRAELEAAAVVPAGRPGEDDLLRRRVGMRRIAFHLEARNARALRLVLQRIEDVGNVEIAIRRHRHRIRPEQARIVNDRLPYAICSPAENGVVFVVGGVDVAIGIGLESV